METPTDTGGLFDLTEARERAIRRRAAGVAADFDPARLTLARRLAGIPRTQLAAKIGVTAAAVTQYEKGKAKPTLPLIPLLAAELEVTPEFFRAGSPVPSLSSGSAHFRSLRATSSLERERALAFAEIVLAAFSALEELVELPTVALPELSFPPELDTRAINDIARTARAEMSVDPGPVPNMVRVLEAHGVITVFLDQEDLRRVDAFSNASGYRPVVLLSSTKNDKARSRFDAAHELGHLLLHHDAEPGSRIVEQQAHAFAAEFLMPSHLLVDELPRRLDWVRLHELKRRWGVSLKALLFRAHELGVISTTAYQRGMRQLALWGLPEPGDLGTSEEPRLFKRAVELLDGKTCFASISKASGLPLAMIEQVWKASRGDSSRPAVVL